MKIVYWKDEDGVDLRARINHDWVCGAQIEKRHTDMFNGDAWTLVTPDESELRELIRGLFWAMSVGSLKIEER